MDNKINEFYEPLEKIEKNINFISNEEEINLILKDNLQKKINLSEVLF